MLILQLLTILLQTFSKTHCRSTQFALVAEANQIAKSDDLQFRKRVQSINFSFSFSSLTLFGQGGDRLAPTLHLFSNFVMKKSSHNN